MGIWTDLILDMDVHRLIALVGGGGKTSTLYALAREAVDRGRGVVVTTTTHIMPHPRLPLTDDPAALPGLLAERPPPWAGGTSRASSPAPSPPIPSPAWPRPSWWRPTAPASTP